MTLRVIGKGITLI